MNRLIIYTLFFLSGAVALVYEISWSRQLGLRLGNTAHAAGAVLSAYFVGLGIGCAVAGPLAKRIRWPLAAYGVCEIIAGCWTLLVPTLFVALQWFRWGDHLSSSRTVIESLACLATLLPATAALGATLPLIAKAVEPNSPSSQGGFHSAVAYGLNTLGALVGVLLATFYLLPNVGVVGSSYLAATIAILCGFAAVGIQRTWAGTLADPAATPHSEPATLPTSANHSPEHAAIWKGYVSAAGVGFASIGLQVLYTRMFSLVFHNSTYTFGLVVAVYLLGLGLAGLLAGWTGRHYSPRKLFGVVAVGCAVVAGISPLLFLVITELKYFTTGDTFTEYLFGCGLLVLIVVLPVATGGGMLLPLLWQFAGGSRPLPATIGRLTAINTWAGALGAMAASFVLLPWLWLWGSLLTLAAVYLLMAAIALRAARKPMVSVLIVAVGLLLFSNYTLLLRWDGVPANEELIARWEGPYGWIDVVRSPKDGELSLRENIHYRHGATDSVTWERRQGHLPLLLHPSPKHVLYLGMGTGATARSGLAHDSLQQIDVVELIPEVVKATTFFDQPQANLSEDNRVTIHVDDARRYLQDNRGKYDVIIADLYVPWESKTGYLYTVEHFKQASEQLSEDGLFCQWLAMWQLGEEEFAMIADSFKQAFPHTTLWWGEVRYRRGVLALVGSHQPLTIDLSRLQQRLNTLNAKADVDDRRLLSSQRVANFYIGQWPSRADGLLNEDEFPRLEFSMPQQYTNKQTLSRRALQEYYDRYLSRLAQSGVVFANDADNSTSPTQRRNWQRLQLRK